MAVTRPKSPNFQKTKQRPLERDYVNEAAPQIDKFATLPPKRPTTAASEVQVKQPSSTRAMQLSQARRREEIVAKKEKEELAKKEDQKRKSKQERVSNPLLKHLSSQFYLFV